MQLEFNGPEHVLQSEWQLIQVFKTKLGYLPIGQVSEQLVPSKRNPGKQA